MGLPKGISGNPLGTKSKKRERALTKVMEEMGDREFLTAQGNPSTFAKETARLVWQLAAEGKCQFRDGRVLEASVRDWRDTVGFIYGQVDGPARLEQDINLTGMEGALQQAPIEQLLAIVRSVDITDYTQLEAQYAEKTTEGD